MKKKYVARRRLQAGILTALSLFLFGCEEVSFGPTGSGTSPEPPSGTTTSETINQPSSTGTVSHRVSSNGTNLSVTPSNAQVTAGTTQALTVTPSSGFVLSSAVGGSCPPGSWSGQVYVTGAITSNCTVSFSAALPTYSVTPSGTNVSVSPGVQVVVTSGGTRAFTVTANSGFLLSNTVAGTCPQGNWSGQIYTTGGISANCTVSFSAALPTYSVTPSGTNVSVSPGGVQVVTSGQTRAFTVTASSGFLLSNTVGGTCPQGNWSGPIYTTGGISANCTVVFTGTPILGYAYVANYSGDSLSMYSINGSGALDPISPTTIETGRDPIAVAVNLTPTGKFAYAVNEGGDSVSMFKIDPNTGRLTAASPATVATGAGPKSLAIHPMGKFAYVANEHGNSVSMYTINTSNGVLTAASPATVSAGGSPRSVTVHPTGRFAYVANYDDNTVSSYRIDAVTGLLSATSPATVASGNRPGSITVHPSGKFAYVTNIAASTVSMYSINAVTGVLSPLSPATAATGACPFSLALTSAGNFAYVANWCDGSVSMFKVNGLTGALTPTVPSPQITTGAGPYAVSVERTGKFAYVVHQQDDTVMMYQINATTGLLSPLSPASIRAGGLPAAIVIAH